MESFIFIFSSATFIGLVYVLFFKKDKQKRERKSYYLKRFLRNSEQSMIYIYEVEAIAGLNNSWEKFPFEDREITFTEYIELLKANYEKDYSQSMYKVLKKNKLTNAQKQEYARKLIEHSEELYLMEVDLGILNRSWTRSVS